MPNQKGALVRDLSPWSGQKLELGDEAVPQYPTLTVKLVQVFLVRGHTTNTRSTVRTCKSEFIIGVAVHRRNLSRVNFVV
ncbi:hypothetical protein UY3_08134 [Chelonia mydas]|uniref:Uncharacterized protein n=1 Tax=Chelonia mydas TaxID=8469 RepID=M7B9S0_CHEMY|nr:hypothetical protein UY3_08134 [Chelonia mydas]